MRAVSVLPFALLTASEDLVGCAQKAGNKVLVQGGSGHMVVQLAKKLFTIVASSKTTTENFMWHSAFSSNSIHSFLFSLLLKEAETHLFFLTSISYCHLQ